ncbi:MAG: ammonia-forming cytochrome c nitrite reductase subunit c552 [Kiritimatiellae bacterium]|nr:ammonia-forming cytochrome c nitrite reductase subunit c552 [Kiritimatiellia bacterium]
MSVPGIGKRWELAVTLLIACGCAKEAKLSVIDDAQCMQSIAPDPNAQACAACHPDIVEAWIASQHANANRLVSPDLDAGAFTPDRTVEHGSFVTTLRQRQGIVSFITSFSNQPPETFHPEAVIGITPLRQYLVPFPGGRLQTVDLSYDPRSNDWFNAFGDDNRQPHEWGFWKNRSMTWNVQCAFCHTTGFEKHYDIASDSYDSTWQAMGVSCAQCHTLREGVSPAGQAGVPDRVDGFPWPGRQVSGNTNVCPMIEPFHPVSSPQHPASRTQNPASGIQHIHNCASCHARREELFGTFKPGDDFNDHYRLTLPDTPGIFQHDGQVLDEDFEYASFRMSRMGHMGVTCLDCHDPHSGKLKAPLENNAICMQCHTPPGLHGAIPIDAVAHSFHPPGEAGSRCVDCHMPENLYMARDWRRDHGFTSPDPLLTIEHGVPNACNRCHTDQTAEWANGWTEEWYGEKMERRSRDRARVVARAHQRDESVGEALLAMAESEEITAWRAALNSLLAGWNQTPAVLRYLQSELTHPDPMVRSASIRSLPPTPESQQWSKPLRKDSSALVRIDAAWATLNPREREANSYGELRAYLKNIADQPPGALRNAQFELMENRPDSAEIWAAKALAWDHTPVPHYALGRIQHILGKAEAARSNLTQAATLDPENAEYSFSLALLLAEQGQAAASREWLEFTVERAPGFGRAWYNLGLAYAGEERLDKAADALIKAGELAPSSPEPPFALATVYARMQNIPAARQALRQALAIDATHAPSLGMLRQLSAP